MSVWGVSVVAILDCSLNVYACGQQKALTMPAYCVAANRNNSQATQSITMHKFPWNRPPVRRKWVKFVQFKQADFDAAPHLCSEHFTECNFVNFMAEYKWDLLQSGICRAVHQVTNMEKNSSSNLQGWSWRAASTQHNTKNWEIHWYPETSANKAKTKSLTRMPTAEKAMKERDRT